MPENRIESVVITGATAGVGRATARLFASHGAKIALLARGLERLHATKKECEERGASEVIIIPTDVSEAEQVEKAAQIAEDTFGGIDVWVNNAMVSVFSTVSEMLPEEYLRVTRVTYLGQVHGTMAALKRMRPRNKGSIIQVGSALAYRGIPLQSAYCAAKHAIKGFTESLITELLHEKSNVHVTMVELPAVNTPQFQWEKSRMKNKSQPVPPIYQPEVPASAIYFAAHHKRREILVGFSTYKAIYGNKFFPAIADKYLARTGFASQQTDEPRDKDAPVNLWEPVPGDYGCHGAFNNRSRRFSMVLWISMNRKPLLIAGAFAGAMVLISSLVAGKGNSAE